MLSVTLTAEEWSTVVAMLELTSRPWPETLARIDLALLRADVAAGHRPRMLGRDALAFRWAWTPHQVRAFIDGGSASPTPPGWIYFASAGDDGPIKIGFSTSPNLRQRIASLQTGSATPIRLIASRPGTIQDEKALHKRLAADRLHGEWFRPSPAVIAAIASPDPVTSGSSSGFRQADADRSPAQPPTFPPHTPPSDLPLMDQETDPERGYRGEGADAPASPAELAATGDRPQLQGRLFRVPDPAERAAAIPEAQAFLQVWTRWRHAPNAPHRWAGGPAEALGWFLEQLGMPADTEIGRAISKLDVVGALQAWDAWLSDRADEHGRPGTAGRSKFPHNWKSALRNWLINQVKFGRNLKASATGPGARRGAWAGQATRFAPRGAAAAPAPADHGEAPSTCTTPGDHDALDAF